MTDITPVSPRSIFPLPIENQMDALSSPGSPLPLLLSPHASARLHNPPSIFSPKSPPKTEEGCFICMDSFTTRRKSYPVPCLGTCVGATVHYRCIMAWLGQNATCPLCRGPCDVLAIQPSVFLQIEDISTFVSTPVPVDAGIVRCYVKQIKRGVLKPYGYACYLQGPVGDTTTPDRLLLTATKTIRTNMTSIYMISTDIECKEAFRVGKMGANFLGTAFTLYDTGRDPQKVAKVQDAPNSCAENVLQLREELGCITYEPNRTSVGPRKMRIALPEVDEEDQIPTTIFRPTHRKDRLVTLLASNALGNLRTFHNREPVFREDLGAYCLDFGGRVSMPSVKNFQLVADDAPGLGNILQFGRVSADMYTMDFQWPLSPMQAFAIVLSSCDTKLACV